MIENRKEIHLYDVPENLDIPEISEVGDVQLDILEKFIKGEKVIDWLQGKMKGISSQIVSCRLILSVCLCNCW